MAILSWFKQKTKDPKSVNQALIQQQFSVDPLMRVLANPNTSPEDRMIAGEALRDISMKNRIGYPELQVIAERPKADTTDATLQEIVTIKNPYTVKPTDVLKTIGKGAKAVNEAVGNKEDKLMAIYRYLALPAMGIAESIATKGKSPGTSAMSAMGAYDSAKLNKIQTAQAELAQKEAEREYTKKEKADVALTTYQDALKKLLEKQDTYDTEVVPQKVESSISGIVPSTGEAKDYGLIEKNKAIAKRLGIDTTTGSNAADIQKATLDYLRSTEPLKYEEMRSKLAKEKKNKSQYKFGELDEKQVNIATKLRNEYLTKVKPYDEYERSYNRLMSVSNQNNTAADDYALVYAFNKMLDESSVVRESEFANTAGMGGIFDRFKNWLQKTANGQRLQPSQRAEIRAVASKFYEEFGKQKKTIASDYSKLANALNVPPEIVIPDLSRFETIEPISVASVEESTLVTPIKGKENQKQNTKKKVFNATTGKME